MIATNAQIREKYALAVKRLKEVHLRRIANIDGEILLISTAYPGVWLEHAFDGLCYARIFDGEPEAANVAKNQMLLFIENQKADGHLPYRVLDPSIGNKNYANSKPVAFTQLQECVSFGSLCLETYKLCGDKAFLIKAFHSLKGWLKWQKESRMTTNRGLIETFCVFDTGHDNSLRLDGIPNGCEDSEGKIYEQNGILPLLSPDVNAVYYGNLMALCEMAKLLNDSETQKQALKEAHEIKDKMFELLYEEKDEFFYDVDRNGHKRKLKTIAISNVFSERILEQDQFDLIYERYFKSEKHFAAPYPFPSMSLDDSMGKPHSEKNCWGYYSQALTALRAQLWMDYYGRSRDLDDMLLKWVNVYASQDDIMFSQEIDPYTGQPTDCSRWYSSAMLTYLYAVKRLKLI